MPPKVVKKPKPKMKVFRNEVVGVSKDSIERLARKAGIVSLSRLMYEEIRGMIKYMLLEPVIKKATSIMHGRETKTLTTTIAKHALNVNGMQILEVNGNAKMPKCKVYARGVKPMTSLNNKNWKPPKNYNSTKNNTSNNGSGVQSNNGSGRSKNASTVYSNNNNNNTNSAYSNNNSVNNYVTSAKLRLRPGMAAIRQIRFYQQQHSCLYISKTVFDKVVRELLSDYMTSAKASPNAIVMIQMAIEAQIVKLLQLANLTAIHAGRKTVMPKDINLVRRITSDMTGLYDE